MLPHQQTQQKNILRYHAIIGILIFFALILIGRIVYLTIFNRAFLQNQGDMRAMRDIEIPANRGMILDRNGYPLAISTPVATAWTDPASFDLDNPELITLAKYLGISTDQLKNHISQNKHRSFLYLKRGLDPTVGMQIKNLNIPGVYLQQEYRRFYPEGEVTAHILGFTNIDDHGQEGLELAYNTWLMGEPGKTQVLKDRFGHVVADLKLIKPAVPGHNLVSSIDRRIQFVAYQALQAGVDKYHTKAGTAIVMDVKTGEILALVNSPSYNPNNRPEKHGEVYRNRALTDIYEPGSVMKTFSMVSALASGQYKSNSTVNTAPGFIIVGGHKVSDEHNLGLIDVATVLGKSSNVGMTKITLSLPYERLWQTFHAFGFGAPTESSFPGESTGALRNENPWHAFALATMSWGYGLSVTPIQLARAYGALGNNGVLLPISLVKINTPPKGQEVVSPLIAKQILDLLESVIYGPGGTAPLAKVPGFRVTGKTGTAYLLNGHTYTKTHRNGTFVGLVPAKNPKILVLVVLYDLSGKKNLAGYTAGPIFAKIAGSALHLLGTLPDDASPDTAPPEEGQAISALDAAQAID